MTKKLFIPLVLCLSLLGTVNPVLAQADEKPGEDILAKLQREGWKIVNEGVLQRELRPGKVESFVFGVPGFTWQIQELRRQLQKLQAEFRANPTPELRKAVANHRKVIANAQRTLEAARTYEALGGIGVPKEGCVNNSSSPPTQATAGFKTDVQGVWADAVAAFSGDCYAEVYAYAIAKTSVNGEPGPATIMADGPRSAAGGPAHAYAESNGGAPCESYAFSYAAFAGSEPFASSQAEKKECPAPLDVTVTSDAPSTTIDLFDSDCITITWTANISGGASPYSSTMYLNGASQGTGPTYSGTWCNTGTDSSITLDASATVTDSSDPASSKSGSAPTVTIRSHVTSLNVTVASDAPSTTIDLYNSDCITITWTTNISGGAPPYTSTMSVNGAPLGTRTTFTGTRCNDGTNSSQTFTVSATVRDSGNPVQSKSGSSTITIRNHVKLAVTVNSDAPSTTIDLYNSDCITITWTANISGGTSPYSSTMYLNNASQGARKTYSKTYCNAGTNTSLTDTVSVTVTDSSNPPQAKSASAAPITIRSHTVTSTPPPTVTINGPSQAVRTCTNYTWTASVSGGTSPFTYQWTWDGEADGTESSNTKKFCVTYGTHTLGLTVTDSAGRSASTSLQVEISRR